MRAVNNMTVNTWQYVPEPVQAGIIKAYFNLITLF